MVVGLTVAAVPVQPKYVRTLAIAEAAQLKGTLAKTIFYSARVQRSDAEAEDFLTSLIHPP